MIVTKTPYRLSLFGGGTDYPAWFKNKPSKVISAAMAHYCYVNLKELPPFFDNTIRLTYSKIENVNSLDEIQHPAFKGCLKYMGVESNITIGHEGDLPARSGIGSSSSFTVGLLNALHAYKNQTVTKDELAREAIYVEQEVIGENVGIQDQIMAAKGGIQLIEMGPDGWKSDALKISKEYKTELESHIMLGFSGVSRHSEVQSKKKVENIKSGTNHTSLMNTVNLAEEAIDLLAKEQEMITIGNLLNIGWSLKRNLAEGVTEDWIDEIYRQSIINGSFGGKLMGAGGGGFFMFLVPPKKQKVFKEQMNSIKVWVPFKFDNDGSQVINK